MFYGKRKYIRKRKLQNEKKKKKKKKKIKLMHSKVLLVLIKNELYDLQNINNHKVKR